MGLKKPTETDLVRQTLQFLHLHRICAWRCNAGAGLRRWGGRMVPVKSSPEGTPDIIGILPAVRENQKWNGAGNPPTHLPPIAGGRFLGIELKAKKGRLRESQIAWAESAREAGALVITARSLAEVEEALRREGYLR